MPNVPEIGFALSNATRARALEILMSGRFLSVTDLARSCRVPTSSMSEHLSLLLRYGLVRTKHVGRHRYFTLASEEVATLVEAAGVLSTGYHPPRSLAESERARLERMGRFCWNHFGGKLGVEIRDHMLRARILDRSGDDSVLTRDGSRFVQDLLALDFEPDTIVPSCVDGTERLLHLRGAFAAGLARQFKERKFVREGPGRSAVLTAAGKDFMELLRGRGDAT